MGDKTGIQWADSTLNLWIGCTQISPACDNCYAMRVAPRLQVPWNAPPKRTAASAWAKIAGYQRSAARFFAKHGRPRRVFINSLSDFMDNQALPAWQSEACAEFEAAPDVIWMLVTKRPQLVRRMVPVHWLREGGWPPNVWLLVTTENQVEYDRRCTALLDLPVPVRGVSMEPMLEPIQAWAHYRGTEQIVKYLRIINGRKPLPQHIRQLEWAIVGGESGRGARPLPPSVRDTVGMIHGEGSAVFMKQLSQADHPATYSDYDTFPRSLQYREFPKHV